MRDYGREREGTGGDGGGREEGEEEGGTLAEIQMMLCCS